MRTFRIQYTGRPYSKEPNKAFFKEMSRQISDKLILLIENEDVKKHAMQLVGLTVDNRYYEYAIQNKPGSLTMFVSSQEGVFGLCKINVTWSFSDGENIYPYESIAGRSILFDVTMERSERNKLNYLLPQLYSPVIKSEESGYPFDYQIHFGGHTFVLKFNQDMDIETIRKIAAMIRMLYICAFSEIHGSPLIRIGNNEIRMTISPDRLNIDIIMQILNIFKEIPGIQRITVR